MNALTSKITWHAVTDTMPDADTTVLIYCPKADEPVWMGFFDGIDWRYVDADVTARGPTHWADLPDPPASAKEDVETGCAPNDGLASPCESATPLRDIKPFLKSPPDSGVVRFPEGGGMMINRRKS